VTTVGQLLQIAGRIYTADDHDRRHVAAEALYPSARAAAALGAEGAPRMFIRRRRDGDTDILVAGPGDRPRLVASQFVPDRNRHRIVNAFENAGWTVVDYCGDR